MANILFLHSFLQNTENELFPYYSKGTISPCSSHNACTISVCTVARWPTQKNQEKAIRAAVCLVRLCNFHTAIIAGREITIGSITSPIQAIPMPSMVQPLDDECKLQQLVLSQPAQIVSASHLTNVSKFRSNGGKQRVFLTIANKQLASLSHKKGNVSSQFSKNSNG